MDRHCSRMRSGCAGSTVLKTIYQESMDECVRYEHCKHNIDNPSSSLLVTNHVNHSLQRFTYSKLHKKTLTSTSTVAAPQSTAPLSPPLPVSTLDSLLSHSPYYHPISTYQREDNRKPENIRIILPDPSTTPNIQTPPPPAQQDISTSHAQYMPPTPRGVPTCRAPS